jgi:hypothetical protein
MIQSENAPTLCPRCVHFTKGTWAGCRIGNYGIVGAIAERIQAWLREQSDESSWTYQGACPSFQSNGSSPHLLTPGDRRALVLLLTKAP